jgi:hypothetical protein
MPVKKIIYKSLSDKFNHEAKDIRELDIDDARIILADCSSCPMHQDEFDVCMHPAASKKFHQLRLWACGKEKDRILKKSKCAKFRNDGFDEYGNAIAHPGNSFPLECPLKKFIK